MSFSSRFFLKEALNGISRSLGLTDRADDSKTYGCADRSYWHYRTIDFPNLRFQEVGLLIALVYSNSFEGNIFFQNPKIFDWCRGIWQFWLNQLNSDGSGAEVYPNERSFCATAFSALALMETQSILKDQINISDRFCKIERTMEWLSKNINWEVSNQTAASFAALRAFAAMTGEPKHYNWAKRRCDELLSMITDDGVFPEYGGFDAGYQSITLSVLNFAIDFEHDPILEAACAEGRAHLTNFLLKHSRNPDLQNSRQTQYIFPSSLVESGLNDAKAIAEAISRGLYLRPSWMDDRYCIGLTTDFLRAGLRMNEHEVSTLQSSRA